MWEFILLEFTFEIKYAIISQGGDFVGLLKLFTKTKQSENADEIKEFFFHYHGDSFMMDREDSQKYKQYRTLKESTKEQWRQELITKDFEFLEKPSENIWIVVENIINLISSSKSYMKSHFKKMLVQIIKISPALDKRQRILILEHFAGRTSSGIDGGIYLITSKTSLKELVITTINALSDFSIDISDNTSEIGWEDMQQRYNNVQRKIQYIIRNF